MMSKFIAAVSALLLFVPVSFAERSAGCKMTPFPHPKNVNVSCRGLLTPDVAVISGSLVGTAASPSAAKLDLEAKRTELARLVSRFEGQQMNVNRSRAVRFGNQFNQPPKVSPTYFMYEMFQLRFSPDADLDEVLSALIDADVQLGSNLMANYNHSQLLFPVTYKFSDPLGALDAIVDNCLPKAAQQACSHASGEQRSDCEEQFIASATVNNFSLQSQKVPSSNGYPVNISVYYPNSLTGLTNAELVSDATLKMEGSINFSLRQ